MKRFYIDKVWIDDTCLWIETKDGRKVCTPFSKWKRLVTSTKNFVNNARKYGRISVKNGKAPNLLEKLL